MVKLILWFIIPAIKVILDALNYGQQLLCDPWKKWEQLTRVESTKCGYYTLVRGEIKMSQSQDMGWEDMWIELVTKSESKFGPR